MAGSTNQNSVGADKAKENVLQCITDCLQSCGKTAKDVAAIALCMSGVDREEDRATTRSWLTGVLILIW